MTSPQEITRLVARAQSGDAEAYDRIVRQFQDMAVGYAASLLGDFHLAQDAAQDAFVEAYRDLPALRAPAAFAGWLRRIVFKRCDRLTRGKRVRSVPMEAAARIASPEAGPSQAAEQRELQHAVRGAIEGLPPGERVVTVLFYIGAYSHREIAAFLQIPVTTVKSRLHAARGRLKERIITMVQDDLQGARPSRDDVFVARVNEDIAKALAEIAAGDIQEKEIRRFHPAARFRDPHPVFKLYSSLILWAIAGGASEFRLVPDGDGVRVLFSTGGTVREVMTLPKSLQGPATDRVKDGAGMNVEERRVAQEGFTPVTSNGKLYDMFVSCIPAEHGEVVVLRLVPK